MCRSNFMVLWILKKLTKTWLSIGTALEHIFTNVLKTTNELYSGIHAGSNQNIGSIKHVLIYLYKLQQEC